jgi:SAM-dependent methyltransferase
MKTVNDHYGEHYFNFHQKKIGEFGANANMFKFVEFVKPEDTVLDFGCGGGYLLNNLNCKKKIGIEINPVAREVCLSFDIECFPSLDDIKDNSIDLIISNNCLEHTESPSKIIEELYSKLIKGGRIVIVVPCDRQNLKFIKHEINNHLYSFSPMNLGNLLQNAGFEEIKVKAIYHKWPPIPFLVKYFGMKIFHFASYFYGFIDRSNIQVRGVAVKK